MLTYTYEYLREYKNKFGTYPPTLGALFDSFPELEKQLSEFDGDVREWKYIIDDSAVSIIEIDSEFDDETLCLRRDGSLFIKNKK